MGWNEALADLDARREKALVGGGLAKIEKQTTRMAEAEIIL